MPARGANPNPNPNPSPKQAFGLLAERLPGLTALSAHRLRGLHGAAVELLLQSCPRLRRRRELPASRAPLNPNPNPCPKSPA